MLVLRLVRFGAVCAALIVLLSAAVPARAQTGGLRLPFADPPGPNTWLLGQAYGNTVGAFLRGDDWYSAGQRLHFGLDFSAPCGTPLVAVGDGEVVYVDDPGFGSAPHNLVLRLDAGYTALYGHLLSRAPVAPGTRVAAGDPVGLSGDPDETCVSRPHLHLELRSLDYQTTYNPASLIVADWHALAAIGPFSYPLFQQDLDNARRWMDMADQPDVRFWGAPLNLYAAPFPDYRQGTAPPNPLLPRPALPLPTTFESRALTFAGCCAGACWHPLDPTLVTTIDGALGQRASLYTWRADREALDLIGDAPPPMTSADGTYQIVRRGAGAYALIGPGGQETVLQTGGVPSLSSDNALVMWGNSAATADGGEEVTVWVANADGSSARAVALTRNGGALWLDDRRLLVTERTAMSTRLSVVDAVSGENRLIGALDGFHRLRGLSAAPSGGAVMFFLMNQPNPADSGVYWLSTAPGAAPQKLPWFGAWRWRDAESVYYTPFTPGAAAALHVYHLGTGEDRALADPAAMPFRVANGDWAVNADGTRLIYRNAADGTTWVVNTR